MLSEVKKWPYNFPASEDFPKANERVNVTGRFYVFDNEQTRVLLTSVACFYLRKSDFSECTQNLSLASRAVLLSGAAELYQQMLAKALAHFFEAKLLLLKAKVNLQMLLELLHLIPWWNKMQGLERMQFPAQKSSCCCSALPIPEQRKRFLLKGIRGITE